MSKRLAARAIGVILVVVVNVPGAASAEQPTVGLLPQNFTTVAGAEEIVSTRLEPGADPVIEDQRSGTVLAVIRRGNVDLE